MKNEKEIKERKPVDEALKDSEERYRTIVEYSNDMIWTLDNEGKFLFFNKRSEQISGYKLEDWLGKSFAPLIIKEDLPKVIDVFQKTLKGQPQQYEISFTAKDGRIVTIEGNTAPIYSEGKVVGTVTLGRDITEQKKAQDELKESEEKYRRLFEYSNDIIVYVDKVGKVLAVNNKLKETLGFAPQEVIGKNFVNLGILGIRDLPRIFELFKKTVRKGMTRDNAGRFLDKVEMELRTKSGNLIPVETSTTLLKKDGKIEGFLTNIRDITQRKRAEEFTSRRNRQLRILSNAGQKINAVLEIPAIMQNLVSSAMEITDSTAGTAGMIVNEKMVFSQYNKNGKLLPIDYAFEKGYGVPGRVMETRSPYISNDTQHDPYVIPEIRKILDFYNLANIPILDRKGGLIGCFEIHNTKEHRLFDQLDIEMLQGLASSAAIAIENARMMDEIRRTEEDKKNLSSILEKSLNEIYLFDAETLRFTYVNSGACKNLGYSVKALRSMTPLDLKPEFDEESFHTLIGPLLQHEKNKLIFRTVHQRSDGSTYPVEVHLQLIEKPSRVFLAMIIDITERSRIEKDLMLSEEKYRTLYETMAQGVVYHDATGEIISLNPAAQKILGLSVNHLIGRTSIDPAWRAIHEDGSSFPGDMHPSMIALRTRKKVSDVIMGVFNPGENQYRWIMINAVPQFRYAQTKPYQVYSTFDDITNIKRAEEEIQAANRELMTINHIITATTGILDLDRILETVLDESMKFVGFEGGSVCLLDQDETLKLTAHRGLSEGVILDLAANKVKVGECLCGESAHVMKPIILPGPEAVEKFNTRESSFQKDIRYHAAFPIVTSGKCVGVLCIFTRTDKKLSENGMKFLETITAQVGLSIENARLYQDKKDYVEKLEKKVAERTFDLQENQMSLLNIVDDMNRTTDELEKANKRLLELDRMKSMFIASTSHELRTPLNSIIGFTSILLEGWSGELTPEQREQVQIVNTSGKHLLSLINDVIDISQIEAGRLDIHVSKFNLKEVIDEVISTLKPELDGKGLLLHVEAMDVELNTDRKRLLQCLMNLLSNAVKFTEAGEIRMIAKSINNELEISVIDTGIGIKKEDIPKLFAAFVRLDSTLTAKTSGTGLGLYFTQKLVKEVLMGSINVESEYGKGSVFSLRIPKEVKI